MKPARFMLFRLARPLVLGAAIAGSFTILARPAASECTQPILFTDREDYVTGSNTVVVATGDFNEDGIIDLAVSNSFTIASNGAGSSVTILLGQGTGGVGNGTFGSAVNYLAGNQPHYIAATDLNDDGITDLLVGNLGSDNISVLLGQGSGGVGNGTFSAPTQYLAGSRPHHLVIGDFNEDGITDVAVANNGTASISVLLGGGSGGTWNGTFSSASYPLGQLSTGIAAGDFNEDGITDLAATENYAGTIAVLLGQGSGGVGNGAFGSKVSYAAGPEPFDITVDDFNDDGISDLAVPNTASGGTVILLGNGSGGVGNGTFGSAGVVPSGNSAGVATADLNQDGITDLAIATYESYSPYDGEIKVFLGQGSGGVGNGTFGGETSYGVGRVPIRPTLGDFNEDGSLDVAIASFHSDFITVWLGTCAPEPPDLRSPTLTKVRDVPNDQGGKVFVTWTRSSLDVSGGSVNSYRVWRRVPPEAALVAGRSLASESPTAALRSIRITRPDGTTGTVYWEALATLPAQRLEGYGYTAPTTQDSMHNSKPYTAFFITALTSNIDVFYDSNIDSGYSVDNIRPGRPGAFEAVTAGSGVELRWDPNSESDLTGYQVYRGTSPDFTPSPSNRIAAPQEPGYFDPTGNATHVYKLSALDSHENESDFAAASPGGLLGVDSGPMFSLEGFHPNPSTSGDLVVAFSLPNSEPATLQLYDMAGRRLIARSVGGFGPGRHLLKLEVPRMPPGVYLLSLRRGGQTLVARAVVAR